MPEDQTLSPWWRRCAIVTIVVCFCVLGWLAKLTYSDAPPIPERVVGPDGAVLFTAADVAAGQQVFLRYGLMENGTIWGHGAYLGPDFSAQYLHTLAIDSEKTVAERDGFVMPTQIAPSQRLIVNAEVTRMLKRNRYDPVSGTLTFTEAEAASYQHQNRFMDGIFRESVAGRRPSARLHQRPHTTARADVVLRVGGLGFGRESARIELLVHQQFSSIPRRVICRPAARCYGARSA